MRIGILHDRLSETPREDELDVLHQVEVVSLALSELGHDPVTVPLASQIEETLRDMRRLHPDFVFNLVESVNRQGRLIHVVPTLLEILDVPYSGCPSTAILASTNKVLAKRVLRGAGIPTPIWFTQGCPSDEVRFVKAPYILKSVWEHASLGLEEDSVCEPATYAELMKEARAAAARLGGEVFAEAYIDGREFNVSALAGETEPEVLPLAEIRFADYPSGKPRIVGYRAKWEQDSFEFRNTPRTFEFGEEDASLLNRLRAVTRACWRVFGLRGYARVDFRVDSAGCPWVLEVNANPCLSPDAGFAAALDQGGIAFMEAVDRILRASLSSRSSLAGIC